MLDSNRGLRVIVGLLTTLGIVAALTAQAGMQKENPNAALKIASVDSAKLMAEYKQTTSADENINKQKNDILTQLKTWQQNPLLTVAEQNELATLVSQEATPAGLNDAQKARKKVLTDSSRAKLDEFQSLQQKQGQLSAADNVKLTDYTKASSDTNSRITSKQQEADADLQKQVSSITVKLQKDVKDAIAKVAKEKNYSLVLNGDLALYSDNDITQAVLKDLNK